MTWLLSHWMSAAAIALATLIVVTYILSSAFKFWVFDTCMGFPLIGRISLFLSRMTKPSKRKADKRLNNVFLGYFKYIRDPVSEYRFNQASTYLRLCGDSGIKRRPIMAYIPLGVLLAVEAYGFSFLLVFALAPDSSEDFASVLSIVVASLVAGLLAYWGHVAGHSRHRAHEIKMAEREAIDEEEELPEGEKSKADLTRLISLADNQTRDEGVFLAYNSQRFLNRVMRTDTENPSYIPSYVFGLAIVGLSVVQFKMRMANSAAQAATQSMMDALNAAIAAASGSGAHDIAAQSTIASQANNEVTSLANVFLIAIFLATQGVAFWIGYRHTFLGPDSGEALGTTGGRTSYIEFLEEFEAKVRRADVSLMSLLGKFQDRYPGIEPDEALYLQRLQRVRDQEATFRGGGGQTPPPNTGPPPAPSPPSPDGGASAGEVSNVRPLPTSFGGSGK